MPLSFPAAARHIPQRRTTLFLAIFSVTLLWSLPLWLTFGKTGGLDWGFFQNQWEVRWRTVWDYGQLPALNPWQGGGLPDNPTPGYLSIQGFATFLLGAKVGLSAFIIFYLLLGAWGFFKLGEILFEGDMVSSAFLAVIGPASPALAFHLAAGHVIIASLMAWPAIIFYLLTAENDRRAGFFAGLLYGLSFNETPYYIAVYGTCILSVGFIVRLVTNRTETRRSLLRFAVRFVLTGAPLVLPTIIAIMSVAADYQRVANTPFTFSAKALISLYLVPATALKEYSEYFDSMHGWWGAWEMKAYLGWGAFILWIAGLAVSRPRWFHYSMAASFIFTLGNLYVWQPMRWLMLFPPFSSHQSFNRLRLFVLIFFALGAAWGLHSLLNRWSRTVWKRRALCVAAIVSALEIVAVSNLVARNAHHNGLPPAVPNERGAFYQRSERIQRVPDPYGGWPADLSLYTRANIGIISELATIPSQFRAGVAKTKVLSIGTPGYVAEFSQGDRLVTPAYWSPNRITFSGLTPDLPLRINLNRGSPWRNFGVPLFPRDRIVEFELPFLVFPDSTGRVQLTYRLPQAEISWAITELAAFGLLYLCIRTLISASHALYLRRLAAVPSASSP